VQIMEKKKKQEPQESKGVDEMNLAELPLAVAGRGKKVCYREITLPNQGKIIMRSPADIGLPTLEDDTLFVGILTTGYQQQFPNKIKFSARQLFNLVNKTDGAANYRYLSQSIKRMAGSYYEMEYVWYDPVTKCKQKAIEGFHLIDRFFLWYDHKDEENPEDPEAVKNRQCWVILGDKVRESIQHNFTKRLNIQYFFSQLKSPLSRKLYRMLDKWFYRGDEIEIDIFELRDRLNLTDYKYPSEVWRKVRPACDELKATHFLKDYKYESPTVTFTKNPDFYPDQKQKTLPFIETKPQPEQPEDPDVKELISHFHTRLGHQKWRTPKGELNYAATLLKNHSLEDAKLIVNLAIERAPESFDMQVLNAIDRWLDQAEEELKHIKEAKAQAEQQARIEQARKKEEEERRKREEAEARKLDAIFASLDPSQKAEIEKEAEQRLNSIEKRFLARDRREGKISELTKLSLDIKRRRVLKDWLSSGLSAEASAQAGKIKTDNESSA